MAITTNELNIANTSYTNKDFEAIYTELLDLAKKISYKFDPAASNESDPFIMLLKLLAFVGDKINYNIDKNILERFLLSATQEKSVRELTDMLGYHMHYYIAPETSVIFTYDDPIPQTLTLNAFTTVILNDNNDIQYVLKETGSIEKNNKQSKILSVIEGTLHSFTVLDNPTITLDNLDGNYRLYFPELMVAENGVFVSGGSLVSTSDGESTTWSKVDNLNTCVYNSRRYSFGFDSKQNLPYIQFPEWIANIIGEGLTINYITTSGENGNVTARTLTNYTLPDNYTTGENPLDQAKIHVTNPNAALNGLNPETINEAINGYKKTVGTFNTLVTCRDYANYIYTNLYDSNENHIVSNIQVGDRRTDINYAWNVLSYTELGEQIKSEIKPKSTTDTNPEINAYDLTLYPLAKVGDTSYNTKTKAKNYEASFKKSSETDLSYIKNKLEYEDITCLSHDYKNLKDTDIYAIKNYYSISAVINTFNKITATEQVDILNKINIALTKTYNARNVDFGYGLDRDDIRNTIQNSDSRIKYVDLRDISIEPKALMNNGDEKSIYSINGSQTTTNDWFKLIISKNIFSGKIEAFDYYKDFEIQYDETDAQHSSQSPYDVPTLPSDKIKKVTTYANIGNYEYTPGEGESFIPQIRNYDATTPGTTYTLKQNEVVQFISPNYVVDGSIYPYGINYNLILTSGKTQIDANEEYHLLAGESITFEWQDSTSKENVGKKYEEGAIIKSKNNLLTTAQKITLGKTPLSKTFKLEGETTETTLNMFMLETTDEVTPLKLNEQKFVGDYKVYWYLDNEDNKIPWVDNTYILQDSEYFYIADSELINFYPFGSGTKLVRGSSDILNESLEKISDITIITEEGLQSIQTYFKSYQFKETDSTLKFVEQEIITLTEGTEIKIIKKQSTSTIENLEVPNNVFNTISDQIKIQYTLPDTTSPVTIVTKEGDAQWQCRGILDINAGPDLEQPLLYKSTSDNSKYKHEIEITYDDATGTTKTLTGYKFSTNGLYNAFKLSSLIQKLGGQNISLELLDLESGDTTYPSLYYYSTKENKDNLKIANDDFNYYNISIEKSSETTIKDKTFKVPVAFTNYNILLMVYVEGKSTYSTSKLGLYLAGESPDFTYISGAGCQASTLSGFTGHELKKGLHILKVDKTFAAGDISFYNLDTTDATKFILSKLRLVKGINPDLGYKAAQSSIESFISDILGNTGFWGNAEALKTANLLNFIDGSRKIATSKVVKLNSPEAFWDYNNIANKWTIPELNIESSDIIISPSSMK